MRLIDADALKERIRRFLSIKSLDDLLPEEKAIVQHIDRMPTVDAVEVVRCRDCKRHHYQNGIPYCDRYYWGWKDDDFCSSGERKDGDHHE